MQNARAKNLVIRNTLTTQLEQTLGRRSSHDARMTWMHKKLLDEAIGGLEAQVASAEQSNERLRSRHVRLRLDTISRFTPQMVESVEEHARVFEASCASDLNAGAAAEILRLGAAVAAKTEAEPKPLAQGRPLATCEAHDVATLLALLDRAAAAAPALKALADRANEAAGGEGEGRVLQCPPKGIARCLAKAHEDYDGDFLRLADLCRITLVFKHVNCLVRALRYLVEEAPGEQGVDVVRLKDRFTERWDAEVSGGNRDLLLNAKLSGLPDGGPPLVVEIQLHIGPLHELKRDLHTLYEGVRILDAREDHTAAHEGDVDDDALEKAELGIVRKLRANFSDLSAADAQKRIQGLLTRDQCSLLELCIGGPKAPRPLLTGRFAGWALSDLLLGASGRVNCGQLRILNLFDNGFTGEIPAAIGDLAQLQILTLQRNSLAGTVPLTLAKCTKLEIVNLSANLLSGAIENIFGAMENLSQLYLNHNKFAGKPTGIEKCARLERCNAFENAFSDEDLEAWAQLPFMRQMNGHVYWEASPAAHSDAATSIQAHVRRKGTKRRHSQPPKPSSFDA